MSYVYELSDKNLCFGLLWQPVVGEVQSQQAKQLARQRKAKQWVIAGQGFFAVGLGFALGNKKKPAYAAAICHALLYPKGWHAHLYRIEQNVYWLAVVHEGTPMSVGDCLFEQPEQALEKMQQLQARYAQLQTHKSVLAIADFIALIATHSMKKAQLQILSTSLGRPLLLFLPLLLAVGWWQVEPAPVEAARVVPDVDPYKQYWQKQALYVNGGMALEQLIHAWEQAPLRLGDWQLKEAQCDAAPQQWRCDYQYLTSSEVATAVELEQLLPEKWQIKELQMNRALLQSHVDIEVATLASPWLRAEQVRQQVLSRLQPIRLAFNQLSLADAVALVPPHALPAKQAAAKYSPIFIQRLRLDGPLRSLYLLEKMSQAVHWQRALLQYKPQAEVSLKSSTLQVRLQGEVYVRD